MKIVPYLFLFLPLSIFADIQLSSIFSDHMVLQRDKNIKVWGKAESGEEISLSIAGQNKSSKADEKGLWEIQLDKMSAGGPHEMVVKGKNEIRIKDVLIGEVWICSGQSNMEWTVKKSNDAKMEIENGNHPMIRHIKAPRHLSLNPLDDINAKWKVCSPNTVGDFTACGYYMARKLNKELKVPIGLINSSWGGTRIEPWTAEEGFNLVPELKKIAENVKTNRVKKIKPQRKHPSVMYNGMVSGYAGYGIRGAIWYQGEANRGDGHQYTKKMKALISGWRKVMNNGDFPFYFVQIAPFQYKKEDPTRLARFWEAQENTLDVVQNTGMVITNDIGNIKDIHPRNKQDVGLRLAILALVETYQKKIEPYKSPRLEKINQSNDKIKLQFDHVGTGLVSSNDQPLNHFEISADGKKFVPAKANISAKNEVTVSADEISKPVAVRFAWHKLATPNLASNEGFPVGAFKAHINN